MSEKERVAVGIVRRLREAGHEAYFAGGCVRDRLLGKEAQDIDVATSARPDEVQRLFRRTLLVGAHFGVVVVVEGGMNFEVATFRTDGEYRDGRRPEEVVFTTAEGDARRRDFTVNGLFFDPIGDRVIDFVGGVKDLESRTIRAIGVARERLSEDKLRVLRGVRFAAVLDFGIEPGTWRAIQEAAPEVRVVSVERIRDELQKVFGSPRRVRGLDLLEASGLLDVVLPEVAALRGCEQPPEFHPEGDVYVHTREMLGLLNAEADLALVWATLLHDVGKPVCRRVDAEGRIRFNGHEHVGAETAKRILRRLRFSNSFVEDCVEMVRNHMAFKDAPNMRVSKLKRFMARPTFERELELHRVDCLGSHGSLAIYEFLQTKRREFQEEPLIPKRILSGDDLIAMGWKPGPLFREVLDGVQTLQLEGKLESREEALAWVVAEYGARGDSRRQTDEG